MSSAWNKVTSLSSTEAESSERREIEEALTAAAGDKKEAARILGISYRTLQRRVKRLQRLD